MIKKGKEKIRKSELIKAEKYQTEPDEVIVADETDSEEIDSDETIRAGFGSVCQLSYDEIREMFVRGTDISNRL